MFEIGSVWICRHVVSSMGILTLVLGLIIVVALYLQKARKLKRIEKDLDEINKKLKGFENIITIFKGVDEGVEDLEKINRMLYRIDEELIPLNRFGKTLKEIEEKFKKIEEILNDVLLKTKENYLENKERVIKIDLDEMVKNIDKTVNGTTRLVKETRKLANSVDFIPALLIIAFGVILLIVDTFR